MGQGYGKRLKSPKEVQKITEMYLIQFPYVSVKA
jgi:hypothetical protein